MAAVVGEAIASGRRSRAIYPARALQEARPTLVARAEVGEQIRVVPELPTRLFIIGADPRVLPEPLGFADEPRLLVRQRGLVEALMLLFELMWDRAAPVPELDRGEARPDLRRLLLLQLADGAKDEQIARTLGHQPAHRAPPDRRPADRARRRLPVPGRGRGGAPRLALCEVDDARRCAARGRCKRGGRQHHRVRRGLDVPGPLPLRAVDLAVGAAPERPAGDRDRAAAQVGRLLAPGGGGRSRGGRRT